MMIKSIWTTLCFVAVFSCFAIADAQEPVVARSPFNLERHEPLYIKAYSLEKFPVVIENGYPKASKEIIKKLEQDISYDVMRKTDSYVLPFAANLALVIGAPEHIHDRIEKCLEKIHSKQTAAPAMLEAK